MTLKSTELFPCRQTVVLLERARQHLSALWNPYPDLDANPNLVFVAIGENAPRPEFNKLIELAKKERRAVYLPDLLGNSAVVNGPTAEDYLDLFSADFATLGLNPADVNTIKLGSLLVVPLITGLQRTEPTIHGALVLGWSKRLALEPVVDLVPLLMYADYLSVPLSHAS